MTEMTDSLRSQASRHEPESLRGVGPPLVPNPGRLLMGCVALLWLVIGIFLLDQLSILLADLWFFDSVGQEAVFWTNFWTGAVLFGVAGVVGFVGVAAAAYTNPVSPRGKSVV